MWLYPDTDRGGCIINDALHGRQHPAPRTMDINEFELENTQKWFQHNAADTRELDRW